MTATSRRFRSLRNLVQAQLSDLTGVDVPGIVVMLPHVKRLDVYTILGTSTEPTHEFLRTLTWIFAEQEKSGDWIYHEVSDDLRDRFLAQMK